MRNVQFILHRVLSHSKRKHHMVASISPPSTAQETAPLALQPLLRRSILVRNNWIHRRRSPRLQCSPGPIHTKTNILGQCFGSSLAQPRWRICTRHGQGQRWLLQSNGQLETKLRHKLTPHDSIVQMLWVAHQPQRWTWRRPIFVAENNRKRFPQRNVGQLFNGGRTRSTSFQHSLPHNLTQPSTRLLGSVVLRIHGMARGWVAGFARCSTNACVGHSARRIVYFGTTEKRKKKKKALPVP